MPKSSGRPGENTTSARLAALLRERGFPSADFERIFTIHDSTTHKPLQRKPDIVFTDGGTHIVSAKQGERLEREALSTATRYLRDLAPVTQLGEVFAVTYPNAGEKFHLHALPLGGHDEISVVLDSLEEVADAIVRAVQGRIAEIAGRAESPIAEVGRILRYSADDIAASLTGVPDTDLEEIFGGHEFFHSTLATILKGKERHHSLRLGTAYLFVNQLLFYVLLSKAAQQAGDSELYPPIASEDASVPARLRDGYFSRVRARDYEPIYGPDVARHLHSAEVGHSVGQLVDTLTTLAPKLSVPDLVGQVFQNLIPLKVRKPMGAHYTNPNSARLLANLAIDDAHSSVMDPACGSGTLLVASYKRKRELARGEEAKVLHRKFIEKEITGIDAMAFSCHLASVNLALQQPLLDTDYVRIGRVDSTTLLPGVPVQPSGKSLPQKLLQRKIYDPPGPSERTGTSHQTIPVMKKGLERPFMVNKVDVVIMNPPFTSQNNLAPEYREQLKFRFQSPAAYRNIAFWKTSQQVYFCLLADRFLRSEGTLAAVLPFTTFTGRAFQPLIRYLVSRYSIDAIIVGLGRCSFSEDTSLTECLLVAKKGDPNPSSSFQLVGVTRGPDEWTEESLGDLVSMIRNGDGEREVGIARSVHQTELLPEKQGLSTLFLRLDSNFDEAWEKCGQLLGQGSDCLASFHDMQTGGLKTTAFYHGDVRPLQVGPKALVVCRSENRALKETDRLVVSDINKDVVKGTDRLNSSFEVSFPREVLSSCLRRFAYLDRLDITVLTDFIVNQPCAQLTRAMQSFYTSTDAERFLKAIRNAEWSQIITHGSSRVNVCTRADLAAPGTTLLAFWSSAPSFLAGAYGYNVTGFSTPREEHLFTMWFNSTLALIQMIGKATITRGSWMKLEQFSAEGVLFPRMDKLLEKDQKKVDRLWETLSRREVPSLLQQLETGKFREDLDVGLLTLLGISEVEAREASAVMRRGVKSAIDMLVRTMQGANNDSDEDSVET